MMYNTSVTIVIISPHIKESKWIDWEIEHSLSLSTRKGRTSHRNGVVGVIQKVNGEYDWFKFSVTKPDGHTLNDYHSELLYPIIRNNRQNQVPQIYHCQECKSIDALTGSYISYVDEDTFLANIDKYIDNAYDKSENDGAGYDIHPSR